MLVAAETLAFGGHRVAVDVLESGPDGFIVAVRESPPPRPGPPWRGPVEDRELVWWARDDRGNHYLAAHGDDEELRFPTPLDPLAATLDLMPTAIGCQAIISFPLQ